METSPLSMQIGSKLAYQRKKLKMTQESFGKKIGLSRSSIVNLEKGRHNITIPILYQICNKCGLEIFDILLSLSEYDALSQDNAKNYDFLDNTDLTEQGVADVISIYNKVTGNDDEKKNRKKSK